MMMDTVFTMHKGKGVSGRLLLAKIESKQEFAPGNYKTFGAHVFTM